MLLLGVHAPSYLFCENTAEVETLHHNYSQNEKDLNPGTGFNSLSLISQALKSN